MDKPLLHFYCKHWIRTCPDGSRCTELGYSKMNEGTSALGRLLPFSFTIFLWRYMKCDLCGWQLLCEITFLISFLATTSGQPNLDVFSRTPCQMILCCYDQKVENTQDWQKTRALKWLPSYVFCIAFNPLSEPISSR